MQTPVDPYYDPIAETSVAGQPQLQIAGTASADLRIVNALSSPEVCAVIAEWKSKGLIKPVNVDTGGGNGGVGFGSVKTHYTTAAPSSAGSVQLNVSKKLIGVLASIKAARGCRSGDTSQEKLLAHLVYWRWFHCDRADSGNPVCPLLPNNLEISHLAKAYEGHKIIDPKTEQSETITQVLLCIAETVEANESRKACARWGHMWRKAEGGAKIGEHEVDTFIGATSCCHGHGPGLWPCYGPPMASGVTPKGLRKKVTGGTPWRVSRFKGVSKKAKLAVTKDLFGSKKKPAKNQSTLAFVTS